MIPFRDQIQLHKIPVLGLVPESSTTAPTSPANGQFWHDPSDGPNGRVKVWLNGAWRGVDSQGVVDGYLPASLASGDYLRWNGTNWVNAILNVGDAGAGTLLVARGGTGGSATPSAGAVAYGDGTKYAFTAVGSAGQFLKSNGGSAPSFAGLLLSDIPDAWIKRSVRAATTVNITLSAPQTIDSIAVVAGDRVLVKNQTTQSQNGIYQVNAGAWTRTTDFDTSPKAAGAIVAVDSGGQGGQTWDSDWKTTDTLGTTAMTFNRNIDSGQKGVANGVAELDASTKLLIARLPTATDGQSSASHVPLSNDGRLSNSRPPNGTAGGALAGSYPNPTLVNGGVGYMAIHPTLWAATEAPGGAPAGSAATTAPALRSLGTGTNQALPGTTRLDTIGAPTAPVGLNGQRLTGVADPTQPQDAATKSYVDSARAGLDPKQSVRFMANGNPGGTYNATGGTSGRGQLTGMPGTWHSKALVAGDRILVINGSASGIFVVTTVGSGANGVWDRATDADADGEISNGSSVFISGDDNLFPNATYVQTALDPITLGGASASLQTWVQYSGAGSIVAGDGLSKVGDTMSVLVDGSSLEISGDTVRVKAAGVTNAMLAGSIDLTTKVAGILPVVRGGTGQDMTTQAGRTAFRSAIAAASRMSDILPALVAGTPLTYVHNLGVSEPHVTFRNSVTGWAEHLGWKVIDANSIAITSQMNIDASDIIIAITG